MVLATDRAKAIDRMRAASERTVTRAQGIPWVGQAIRSFEREQRSGAGLLAGGLAYRFFFWLVSFGLLTAAIASFWVRADRHSMEDAAKSFGLSGVASHSAAGAISSGAHSRWYLLVAGIVAVTYFGIGAVRALRVTAIVGWRLEPTRMRKPLSASGTFTSLFIIALAATSFASWVRHHTPVGGVIFTVSLAIVFAALALFAFHLLPRAEGTGWSDLVPGAVLVGVGCTCIHVFTVYYLSAKLERSPKLYGTLGAATVVLLGLYLIARVIVSAMFLNATLARRHGFSSDWGEEDGVSRADALTSDA
jgi:uncharacterized BrkB/YihY/UPF0761 family membrane protein